MKIWFIVCGWYYDRIDEFYAPLKELEKQNELINVFWACHGQPTPYIKENFNYKYFPDIGLSDTKYQQALDKLDVLYREAPIKGAGDGESGEGGDFGTDTGGGGGGGGDFPGADDAGGGGGEDDLGADDLGTDDAGGADLSDEPVDFEAGEEPEA